MMIHSPRWIIAPSEPAQVERLSQKLGILPAVVQVLMNRGLTGEKQIKNFLNPDFDQLLPPLEMQGMEQAVSTICRTLDRGDRIVIHGDYDADGVTATAILVETIEGLGGEVDFYLPSRFQEGYGLRRDALEKFRGEGRSLVITVDCGITAREEAAYAAQIGLDLIITDHHQPQGPLPAAAAVLNPLQEACRYPFKWLSGAGVAFKLATALLKQVRGRGEFPHSLLDLAALGTVADMVPLLGENRALAALGLAEINRSLRMGLKALAEAGSLRAGKINGASLAFGLAPALNAAGRMGDADPAVELLLERDPRRAGKLAEHLCRQNQLRRDTEAEILAEAEAMIAQDPRAAGEKIIVLAREGWHPGVIGIVASRLVGRFYRPVVIIAVAEEMGCGSARSIPGFNISAALNECRGVLERFGGHDQAAGLTIVSRQVGKLREQLNQIADRRLQKEDLLPCRYLEAELSGSEINLELAGQLSRLEPFGVANPVPVFSSRSWELRSWRLVGPGKNHLKLNFARDGCSLKPILFSGAHLAPGLYRYRKMDLAFNLQAATYRDQPVLNMELKDICFSDSVVSGRLELIDRRGEPGRLDYIRELVRGAGRAAVFVGTRRREEMLRPRLPREVLFITSGKGNRESFFLNPGQACSPLVLYDLPLHFRLLAPYFKELGLLPKIQIHLLYNSRSRGINEQLTAMSLPSEQALLQICRVLSETAAGKELVFPGSLADRLSHPEKYWQQCRDILVETGVLAEGPGERLTVTSCRKGWPEKLELSATYRSARELAEECHQFQERLLQESRRELADYFSSLLENCR